METLYTIMLYGGIALAVICAVVAVILFVKLDIPKAIGIVTGSTARKQIEEIREKGYESVQGGGASKKEAIKSKDKKEHIEVRSVSASAGKQADNSGKQESRGDHVSASAKHQAAVRNAVRENVNTVRYEEDEATDVLGENYNEEATDVLTEGYEEGATDVLTDSYEEGATDVLTESYEEGATDVLTESYEEGATDVLTESYEEGETDVLTESYEEGATDILTEDYEENEGETNVLTAGLEDGERTDVRKDTKLKMIVDVIVVHTDEVV